jgi:hypothetical protein
MLGGRCGGVAEGGMKPGVRDEGGGREASEGWGVSVGGRVVVCLGSEGGGVVSGGVESDGGAGE